MNQQPPNPMYPQLGQMQTGQQPGGQQPGQPGVEQPSAGYGTGQNTSQGPKPETPRDPEEIKKEAVADAQKSGRIWLKWIVFIGLIILILAIAVTVINGLSNLGSDTGFTFFGWFKTASLNPGNPRGFRNLIRLVLTAGFLCLAVMILDRIKK